MFEVFEYNQIYLCHTFFFRDGRAYLNYFIACSYCIRS